jgi:thiol:disulfide interchange protein DsbD
LGGLTTGRTGVANSFLSGVLATVVATPCTAPLMGSALGFALTQSPGVSFAIFTSLGLGMCLPYLILSSNPKFLRFVPKPGQWMETFKQTMGFFMLATVLWLGWVFGHQTDIDALTALLFSLLIQAMGAWIIGRQAPVQHSKGRRLFIWTLGSILILGTFFLECKLAASAHASSGSTEEVKDGLTWEPYSEERVAALRKEGRMVFVDFSAAWCLTCQVNERVVFGNKEVRDVFKQKNIATLKADWTSRDPKITDALQRFERSGVPLYLLYSSTSQESSEILPEILTPQIVLNAVKKAGQ